MCNFASAIVMRNGDLLFNENLISHEDLIDFFNIKDNEFNSDKFVRIEFRPENNDDYHDISKYRLIVDEKSVPEWFNDDLKVIITEKMTEIVKKRIILTDTKILTGGLYVIGKDVIVERVVNAHIFSNHGIIKNNKDTVIYNYSIMTDNYGVVTINKGIVINNNSLVNDNFKIVENNNDFVIHNYAIITNNHGTVTDNQKTVENNDNIVTNNYCTVENNNGVLINNNGVVMKNRNSIINNNFFKKWRFAIQRKFNKS
jgi:hypothetical protein